MGREEFREANFPSFLLGFRNRMATFLEEQQGKGLVAMVDDFLSRLKKQEKIVDSIHISFLYTSFFAQELWVQWDAYGTEGPIVGEKILSKQYPLGSWKAPLEETLQHWLQQGEEAYLQQEITPCYLESWMIESLSPLFRYFITQYRYPLESLFAQGDWEGMERSKAFYVNLGELGGWGKMIYGNRPNQDLAVQTPDSLWNFPIYQEKKYENQGFSGITISWGQFHHCVFEHCKIEEFHWTDCVFDHCTFHDVQFISGFFHGSQFHHCVFLQTTFDGVNFYQSDMEKQDSLDRYRPCVLEHCHMNGCSFQLCYLVEVALHHCQISQQECQLSVVRDSDFEGLVERLEVGE